MVFCIVFVYYNRCSAIFLFKNSLHIPEMVEHICQIFQENILRSVIFYLSQKSYSENPFYSTLL